MGNATPQYKHNLNNVAVALGESYGASGIASGMGRQAQNANRVKFRNFCRAILSLPAAILNDEVKLLGNVTEAFETAKKSTTKGATVEWKRQSEALLEGYKMPISLENARKNSSRSLKTLRPDLCNFLELIHTNTPVAIDSLRVRTGDEKRLNQTEVANIWRTPLDARAATQDMPVNIGTDSLKCVHLLKPDFMKGHDVKTRTLEDGTVEKYCMVSTGSNNTSEEIEVVITQAPSGPLFQAAVAEELKEALTSRKRKAFIKRCRDDAQLPEFTIREQAPAVTDD
jgi:hypothetical protein